MSTSSVNLIREDFYLCQMFAKAISSGQFNVEKTIQFDFPLESPPEEEIQVKEKVETTQTEEKSPWTVGDLCRCPYSADGLLYKATILQITTSKCTVRFDEYGNEEEHRLDELQSRSEEIEVEEGQIDEQEEEEGEILPMDVPTVDPPLPPAMPPYPKFDSLDQNANLSSTLMSWYLAGYHTGYYQATREKNSS